MKNFRCHRIYWLVTCVAISACSQVNTHMPLEENTATLQEMWLKGDVIKTIKHDKIDVTLAGVITNDFSETDIWRAPRLEFYEDGKLVGAHQTRDMIARPERVELEFVELIDTNSTPEVVWKFYTGGAHCCSQVVVHFKKRDEWQAVEVGNFDGSGAEIIDMDGDGRSEFIVSEDRFLYKYTSYACSYKPRKILGFDGDTLVDKSHESKFVSVHERWRERITNNQGHTECGNGYWPAYVVTEVYLGNGSKAWQDMFTQYDKGNTTGLLKCSTPGKRYYECDEEHLHLVTYPESLKSELKDMGIWELVEGSTAEKNIK